MAGRFKLKDTVAKAASPPAVASTATWEKHLDGQRRPAGDGWGALPGSEAGGLYKKNADGTESMWWPTMKAARADAEVFKALERWNEQRLMAKAESGSKPTPSETGDIQNAIHYCHRAGVAALQFKDASPEYFVTPDREKQMVIGMKGAKGFLKG